MEGERRAAQMRGATKGISAYTSKEKVRGRGPRRKAIGAALFPPCIPTARFDEPSEASFFVPSRKIEIVGYGWVWLLRLDSNQQPSG
jgi:hypothetical protein